jgi:hypothetical protein
LDSIAPPWRHYEIRTELSPAEVFTRIRSDSYFEGTLTGDSFQMHRVIRGRNSFLPQITVRPKAKRGATRVSINMRLESAAFAFWLFLIGFAGVSVAVYPNTRSGGVLVVLLFYLVCSTLFGLEARSARRKLYDILQK